MPCAQRLLRHRTDRRWSSFRAFSRFEKSYVVFRPTSCWKPWKGAMLIRITASWASISGPHPDRSTVPELPTRAHVSWHRRPPTP